MTGECFGAGSLDNSEVVARLCFQSDAGQDVFGHGKPSDINPETRQLRYEAIKMKDLRSRGFSVQRVSMFSRSDALRHRNRQRARKPLAKVQLAGVVVVSAGAVRSLTDSCGDRLLEICPKPDSVDRGHSEILIVGELKRSEELKCRIKLAELFGEAIPYRQALKRGSLLNWLLNMWRQVNMGSSST